MTQHNTDAGKLVAVVVTYNRLEQLKITVARLLDVEGLDGVVVVNNAATDGTERWLAQQKDARLLVHRCEQNSGGAGGFEVGMKIAIEQLQPDWLVVMDDDARPEPDAFVKFRALDLSQWDAVAAAVYFPSGEICEMNRPSRNPFWHWSEFWRSLLRGRGGFHLKPKSYELDQGQPIDVTSFVGFFVSRKAIDLIGYPDPELFIYGDDGLYTLALSRAGGRIGFEPSVRFEHDCSTFASAQRGRFHPLWKVYYYHRNLLLLYRLASGWFFVPLMLVILPRWVLKVLDHKGERITFLRILLRAIKDGLLRRTRVSHATVIQWENGK